MKNMKDRIQAFVRELFCRHDWKKIAVFQALDPVYNIRYSIRRYKCKICGKIVHQDSRYDRIDCTP